MWVSQYPFFRQAWVLVVYSRALGSDNVQKYNIMTLRIHKQPQAIKIFSTVQNTFQVRHTSKLPWQKRTSITQELYKHYVGHCPLSGVHFINTAFQKLTQLPPSGDCYYSNRPSTTFVFLISVVTDGIKFRYFLILGQYVNKV